MAEVNIAFQKVHVWEKNEWNKHFIQEVVLTAFSNSLINLQQYFNISRAQNTQNDLNFEVNNIKKINYGKYKKFRYNITLYIYTHL